MMLSREAGRPGAGQFSGFSLAATVAFAYVTFHKVSFMRLLATSEIGQHSEAIASWKGLRSEVGPGMEKSRLSCFRKVVNLRIFEDEQGK
jgi:hypothetical protein